jgi:hypothetical protein
MKNSFTPAYIRQYTMAGTTALIGFVLSLAGGVWFVASDSVAVDLLNGTAPAWMSAVLLFATVLTFVSLWMAVTAFRKAGKEKASNIIMSLGFLTVLLVGQLWHLVM